MSLDSVFENVLEKNVLEEKNVLKNLLKWLEKCIEEKCLENMLKCLECLEKRLECLERFWKKWLKEHLEIIWNVLKNLWRKMY